MTVDRRGKHYVRSTDPVTGRRTTQSSVLPIHAEGTPGNGRWDAAIDLVHVHRTTGNQDLWEITDNAFGFAIGQPRGRDDGWIHWEPLRQQYTVASKLQRMVNLHWPTLNISEIGGAPVYSRDNLQHGRVTARNFSAETFSRKARSYWSDLWPSIPAGQIDLGLTITGDGIKEEVRLTRPAFEWMRENSRPATPLNETVFGALFEVDWGLVQDFVVGEQVYAVTDDIVDQGTVTIRGRARSETLGYSLLGNVYIDPVTADAPLGPVTSRTGAWQLPVVRRIFTANGTPQLFIGILWDDMLKMVAGDLIIDPPQVSDTATGNDDGQDDAGVSWLATGFSNLLYAWWDSVNLSSYAAPGFRFDMSAMDGNNVDSAIMTVDAGNIVELPGTTTVELAADDVANANAFSSTDMVSDFMGATTSNRTTAEVQQSWTSATFPGSGATVTFDVTNIMQELVDSYGETIQNVRFGEQVVGNPNAGYISYWDSNSAINDDPELTVTQSAESGIVQPIGLVTEVDASLPLSSAKQATLGQQLETDAALPSTAVKTRVTGLVQETDSAQPVTSAKTRTLGLVTEADIALSLSVAKAATLGLVAESDLAQAFSAAKAAQLGLVSEADTALPMSVDSGATLGLVTELSTAFAMSVAKTRELGLVTEVDTALVMSVSKARELGLVEENDAAQGFTRIKASELGLAIEADIVFSMTPRGPAINVITNLVERDAYFTVTLPKAIKFTEAAERDALFTILKSVDVEF